ncbi:MAG TPA: hypothetical protein VGJ70_03220 [Solirubrobacteraceae bacterium]
MRLSPARTLALALTAALLAFAAPAGATTLVLPGGSARPQPYQSWVDQSLVPTPAGTVTLRLAGCPSHWDGGVACADQASRTIYLGPGGRGRETFLHELGHIFDAEVMTDAARAGFQAALHLPGAWNDESAGAPPLEMFADAYSLCARYRTIRTVYYAANGYAPGPREHQRACALIRRAGAGLSAG